MKKLIIIVAVVSMSFLASAYTYEEYLELAKTPIDKITTTNADVIVDAGVVTTNNGPITRVIYSFPCREKATIFSGCHESV